MIAYLISTVVSMLLRTVQLVWQAAPRSVVSTTPFPIQGQGRRDVVVRAPGDNVSRRVETDLSSVRGRITCIAKASYKLIAVAGRVMQNLYAFSATSSGNWRVVDMKPVAGAPLPSASALSIARVDSLIPSTDQAWTLHGLMSNLRYAKRDELTSLRSKQEGLGRPSARRAALIPIKKSAAWWDLAQDERRAIFEEQSRHTAIGLDYLPAIARQLYHSRDLSEPFDFLTWFEYAPEHAQAFEDLVGKLRETSEWRYIEREIDIRLERAV